MHHIYIILVITSCCWKEESQQHTFFLFQSGPSELPELNKQFPNRRNGDENIHTDGVYCGIIVLHCVMLCKCYFEGIV